MVIQTPPPAVPEVLTVSAILFVPQQGEPLLSEPEVRDILIFLAAPQNDLR